MGIVYADITLKNLNDVITANIGVISEGEIRQKTVQAIVDTGAISMVINEELCEELGLEITGKRQVTYGNNASEIVNIAGDLEVHWKDRSFPCPALITSTDGPVLLGVIPLEGLDLIVDPVRQKLVGAHGDKVVYRV